MVISKVYIYVTIVSIFSRIVEKEFFNQNSLFSTTFNFSDNKTTFLYACAYTFVLGFGHDFNF